MAAVLTAWLVLQLAIAGALRSPFGPPLPELATPVAPSAAPWIPGGISPLTQRFIAFATGGRSPGLQATSPAPALTSSPPIAAGPRSTMGPSAPTGRRTVVDLAAGEGSRSDAYEIGSVPFTSRGTVDPAARDPDEPSDCAATGGTLWFRFRPDIDVDLLASTTGSSGAVAVAAYDATDRSRQVAMGCDVDAAGSAHVAFHGRAGRTYLFQVGQPLGGRSVTFHLDPLGTTERVSVDTSGNDRPAPSTWPSLSADGRVVAFIENPPVATSSAPSLVVVRDLVSGRREVVSQADDGHVASDVWAPMISGDGRYVAFFSTDPALVDDDTNHYEDLFVRDRVTGRTVRATLSSDGREGWVPVASDQNSYGAGLPSVSLSHDGRHVAFTSDLAGLVPGDDPPCSTPQAATPQPPAVWQGTGVPADIPKFRCFDVFVRDMLLGRTVRVSVASDGTPSDGDSGSVHMSPNGRFVVFSSGASNLAAGDNAGLRDVFLHDRDADGNGVYDEPGGIHTELISVALDGGPANGSSGSNWEQGFSTVSADGRRVAFMSEASNLVANDLNGAPDVFVRDRVLGTTVLVSAPRGSDQPMDHTTDGPSHHAWISADGERVVFNSEASNLIADDDTNGVRDVFVHDLPTRTTIRVSVASDGSEANGSSFAPALSADGWVVTFMSAANNLAPDDRNACPADSQFFPHQRPDQCVDVFVHRMVIP